METTPIFAHEIENYTDDELICRRRPATRIHGGQWIHTYTARLVEETWTIHDGRTIVFVMADGTEEHFPADYPLYRLEVAR